MEPARRVDTLQLFDALHDCLLELLRNLRPDDWERPTACPNWSVRDIAAHILDTQCRLLAYGRDGASLPPPDGELTSRLNLLNAQWVQAFKRVSPPVLIEFLAITGPQLTQQIRTLDPDSPARFPVSWAGEHISQNWFDIGRSYTEYWHHQQQIRDAVGAVPLTQRKWLHPVLALFMRAVPHSLRSVDAAKGTALEVTVTGPAGGTWTLLKHDSSWQLWEGAHPNPAARVSLKDNACWRLFTKGLPPEKISAEVRSEGDARLITAFLGTIAIVG